MNLVVSPLPACPLCGSEETSQVYRHTFFNATRGVFLCGGCFLYFVSPLPTDDELNRFYEESWTTANGVKEKKGAVRHLFEWINRINQQLHGNDRVKDLSPLHLPPTTTLLEIGAGAGLFLAALKNRFKKADGIEPSISGDIPLHRGTLWKKAVGKTTTLDAKYDLLVAFHVLEHLSEPVAVLSHLLSFLETGGKFLIEVPLAPVTLGEKLNERRKEEIFNNPHLFHYSPKSVEALAKATGCVVTSMRIIAPIELIPGYSIYGFYPGKSFSVGYKFLSFVNASWLLLRGWAGFRIYADVSENTPYEDGMFLKFVLQKK